MTKLWELADIFRSICASKEEENIRSSEDPRNAFVTGKKKPNRKDVSTAVDTRKAKKHKNYRSLD